MTSLSSKELGCAFEVGPRLSKILKRIVIELSLLAWTYCLASRNVGPFSQRHFVLVFRQTVKVIC